MERQPEGKIDRKEGRERGDGEREGRMREGGGRDRARRKVYRSGGRY